MTQTESPTGAVYYLTLSAEIPQTGAEKSRLLVLARAEEGILREVLVPADMTLTALHHVIQRCFGWQDMHLHSFHPDQETMDAILSAGPEALLDRCGSLFRTPFLDAEDELPPLVPTRARPGSRAWYRAQYSRPYPPIPQGEYPAVHFRAVKEIRRMMKAGQIDPAMLTHMEPQLLESLTIGQLLTDHPDPDKEGPSRFTGLVYRYDFGDGWQVDITVKAVYRPPEEGGDLANAVAQLDVEGRPLCIAVDGLMLMDDIGGMYGYAEFLENRDSPDMQDFAAERGWTTRKPSPRTLL